MNPLIMAGLAAAPQIMQGIRGVAGGVADAAAGFHSNMPAADPMSFGGQYSQQSMDRFGGNSQFGRGFEDQSARAGYRNYNQRQKETNEQLKRNYITDSYRAAQDTGMAAIDSYLQRAANNDALSVQMATARMGTR